MIALPLQDTFVAVATALADAADPWWVIAGAAGTLYGLGDDARDVDVLLSEPDACLLLPRIGLSPTPGTPHPRFRSALFARWTATPRPVEFMAGFEVRAADRWHPVRPQTSYAFAVGRGIVFAPDRAELAALLRLFGRPGDLARADLLA